MMYRITNVDITHAPGEPDYVEVSAEAVQYIKLIGTTNQNEGNEVVHASQWKEFTVDRRYPKHYIVKMVQLAEKIAQHPQGYIVPPKEIEMVDGVEQAKMHEVDEYVRKFYNEWKSDVDTEDLMAMAQGVGKFFNFPELVNLCIRELVVDFKAMSVEEAVKALKLPPALYSALGIEVSEANKNTRDHPLDPSWRPRTSPLRKPE